MVGGDGRSHVWNTAGVGWALRDKATFMVMQETRLLEGPIRKAKSAANVDRWSTVLQPAVRSTRKGQSQGG
eukprot:8607144-Heterocapsa_arctica.AAC.1